MARLFSVRDVIAGGLFLAVLLVIQTLSMPQPVTGTLVNAVLAMAAWHLNPVTLVLLGIISPILAALRSVVPPVLLTASPFIALGNIFFMMCLRQMKVPRFNVIFLLLGATSKFLVLSLAVRFILTLPAPIEIMLGATQWFTAMAGGLLGYVVSRLVNASQQSG